MIARMLNILKKYAERGRAYRAFSIDEQAIIRILLSAEGMRVNQIVYWQEKRRSGGEMYFSTVSLHSAIWVNDRGSGLPIINKSTEPGK